MKKYFKVRYHWETGEVTGVKYYDKLNPKWGTRCRTILRRDGVYDEGTFGSSTYLIFNTSKMELYSEWATNQYRIGFAFYKKFVIEKYNKLI